MAHGERGKADNAEMVEALPLFKNQIAETAWHNIFNADEFGLLYKIAPDAFVSIYLPEGRKKNQEPITALILSTYDVLEKFLLMFFEKARCPRTFKKKDGNDHELD